jgi:CheY-like chemotaxis protein/chemotaxis signal transduction protein
MEPQIGGDFRVSRPDLLVVDDSTVVLAFLRAALGEHYAVRTATSASEALARLNEAIPDGILLDLSMPETSGEELLERLRASEGPWRDLPVVVVSSEVERGKRCVSSGAANAFVAKPVRAEEIRAVVARVLDEHANRATREGMAVIFVDCATIELAIALEGVDQVLMFPETRPLPGGPPFLCEYFELYGEPVCVLDLACRLGVEHAQPLLERKLVLLRRGGQRLALSVDDVREPELFARTQVVGPSRVGGAEHEPLRGILKGFVPGRSGPTPVLEPGALFSAKLLDGLIAQVKAGTGAPHA